MTIGRFVLETGSALPAPFGTDERLSIDGHDQADMAIPLVDDRLEH